MRSAVEFLAANVAGQRLWELVIVAAIVILILFTRRRGSSKKTRDPILAGMGFLEVSREEAFGAEANAVALSIWDRPIASISTWVDKGSSAIGETLIFDFTHDLENGSAQAFTVIAFRVKQALPDFHVHHHHLLDKFIRNAVAENNPPAVAAEATGSRFLRPAPQKPAPAEAENRKQSGFHISVHGPKVDRSLALRSSLMREMPIEDNPGFTSKYVVETSDSEAMRRVLTSACMQTLESMDDGNLNLRKVAEWLFVYRWQSWPKPAKEYPAMLEEAVRLAGLLDLRSP